jgi:heme exporter protein D
MINEIISMNGYGAYVWTAFSFTLISFMSLYLITKAQLLKEQKKFSSKFGLLSRDKIRSAKLQNINKEILEGNLISKV